MSTIRWITLAAAAAFLLFAPSPAGAQDVFTVTPLHDGSIEVRITEPMTNPATDPPVVKLFEVVTVSQVKRTFERVQAHGAVAGGEFIATLTPPATADGFSHHVVQVLNYRTAAGTESFGPVEVRPITPTIASASGEEVRVDFLVPRTFDFGRFRRWITASAPGSTLTVTPLAGAPVTTNVKGATVASENCEQQASTFVYCEVRVVFRLEEGLPVGQKLGLLLRFPDSAFLQDSARRLPLDGLRAGISSAAVDTPAEQEAKKDRDPVRSNVIEAGGSLTTSLKLDPDPANPEPPERETKGTADLRLATGTIFFADETTRWSAWTPAQFEALISTGKITSDSLATNTMRLYTQLQRVYIFPGAEHLHRLRFVGEGGVAADRDLRVLEYTGSGDFRYGPAWLNRTFGEDPLPDRANTLRVEFMPAGFELGARQVRRDPLFPADTFVRRFRMSQRMELLLPSHRLEFSLENRSWWRGEVEQNRFRNYFTTSVTLFPWWRSPNASAGVFASYERGTLPPFTTPRQSVFKLGVRIRRKEW